MAKDQNRKAGHFIGWRSQHGCCQAELLALQAQLRALQQHKGLIDTISQQRKDLWTTEAKFQVLEEASRSRSLTKQEQSLLASKDRVLQLARQKALLGDQITAQEQLNKRMDTSQKYVTQMAEKQAALVNGAGMSDRQAQRELAKSQLSSGWINSGGTLDDEGYQQQLKAANDYYDAEDRLRGDWLTGAKRAGLNLRTARPMFTRRCRRLPAMLLPGWPAP